MTEQRRSSSTFAEPTVRRDNKSWWDDIKENAKHYGGIAGDFIDEKIGAPFREAEESVSTGMNQEKMPPMGGADNGPPLTNRPKNLGVIDNAKISADLFYKKHFGEKKPFNDYGTDEEIKREPWLHEGYVPPVYKPKKPMVVEGNPPKKAIPKPERVTVKSAIKRYGTNRPATKKAPIPLVVKPNFTTKGYDLQLAPQKPILDEPMPELVGAKKTTPPDYLELRAKLERFANKKHQIDLKPLFAFLDAWNGTNLAEAYKRPLSDDERETMALNAQFELAKLDQTNVAAQLDRDTLEMNKTKAYLANKLGESNLALDSKKTDLNFTEAMGQQKILDRHYRNMDASSFQRNKLENLELDHTKFNNRLKQKQTDDDNALKSRRYDLLEKLVGGGYSVPEAQSILGEKVVAPSKGKANQDPSKEFNSVFKTNEKATNSVIGNKIKQITNGGNLSGVNQLGHKNALQQIYQWYKKDSNNAGKSQNEIYEMALRKYSEIDIDANGVIRMDDKGRPYKAQNNNDLRGDLWRK